MPQLLLATNNPGKLAEFRRLLRGVGWDLFTPGDLGLDVDIEETGETYEGNARTKAEAGARASGLVTLADDSGLEIDAIGGEPGIHSARFFRPDASYAERFAEIQRRLADVPFERRTARFVAVIAIADPGPAHPEVSKDEVSKDEVSKDRDVRVYIASGEILGVIAPEPRGEGGFGYDPIFWVPQHSATMAELPEHQKDIISHRGRAAAVARQFLRELLHEHRPRDPSYSRRPS